jgi:hypothetical protein
MLLPAQIVSMSVISLTISKCINSYYPIHYDHRQVASLLGKAGLLLFTAPPSWKRIILTGRAEAARCPLVISALSVKGAISALKMHV